MQKNEDYRMHNSEFRLHPNRAFNSNRFLHMKYKILFLGFVVVICIHKNISANPSRLGVSESTVHPVPPNSPNAHIALYSHNSQTCPNSACLRFPVSQIVWILRFSERLLEPDHLYRGRSARFRLG